jgi:hypothetical protein
LATSSLILADNTKREAEVIRRDEEGMRQAAEGKAEFLRQRKNAAVRTRMKLCEAEFVFKCTID